MNKDLFYKTLLENVLKEISCEKSKGKDFYDESLFALSVLSHLKDEDFESVLDRHYLKINMTLTDALSLCNELKVDKVEVILKDYGMVLFYGSPKDLLNTIYKDFRDSIECNIYNEGYSILVKHIDNDIIGKDE